MQEPNGDRTPLEAELLADLLALISENEGADSVDREIVLRAFVFACDHHADQRRRSGEDFMVHPVGVAKICTGLRLDTDIICAALLHDTIDPTTRSLDGIGDAFGDGVARLVDGMWRLTPTPFRSRDEQQAENYRKFIVAMANDMRVILIKLADRLHDMRTLGTLERREQLAKANETLMIYAPLADRLGIHAIKWELEDRSFATLHPRKYQQIKDLVNQQREERERYVANAGGYLAKELEALGIHSEISGRAKHFYSIYSKMTRKDREFNEIYDLTAMRVIVDSVKDCYSAVGVIHSLWKPLPGRFKDMVAMPTFNMYQALHTTVIGPEGRPLEIQIRTRDMHETAEYGVAASWRSRSGGRDAEDAKLRWLTALLDWQRDGDRDGNDGAVSWQRDLADAKELMDAFIVEAQTPAPVEPDDEVFVLSPNGEVAALPARSSALDFAYAVHTEVGNHCVGARINGEIAPLSHELQSGETVEIITERTAVPSADWLSIAQTKKARKRIKQWLKSERRDALEERGRELLRREIEERELHADDLLRSAHLAAVIRELGFRRAGEFYIAVGASNLPLHIVIGKLMKRSERDDREPTSGADLGLAECCRPIPDDPIVRIGSPGGRATVHRADCPVVEKASPDRLSPTTWDGEHRDEFVVEVHVDAWGKEPILEELERAILGAGMRIVKARSDRSLEMTQNRFLLEVGDAAALKAGLARIRAVDAVFDAYRASFSSQELVP
jgi:GTP pyrophosphokinase